MRIKIKLFASFRIDRFREEEREYPSATVISRIVDDLKIPKRSLGILLVNGRHSLLSDSLKEGDTLSLLPLMGGG